MTGFDNPDKFFKPESEIEIDQAANFVKQLPGDLQGAVMQNIQPVLQQAQMIMQQQQQGANNAGNQEALSPMA